MKTKKTYSPEETKKLGAELAELVLKSEGKTAVTIGLLGNLGSGKTALTQGFLKALGWKKRVTSPTFIIMRRYPIHKKKFQNVYHVDAYRLREKDLIHLGLEEIKKDPKNIIIVEWPENISLRKECLLKVRLEHGEKENERTIKINENSAFIRR